MFEAAMERNDFYAAIQALTMKARLAGFADYLPGVRILRREARDYEQEFWARAHAAEQRITAVRLGEVAGAAIAGGAAHPESALEAKRDAEMFAEGAAAAAQHMAMKTSGARERRARAKRGLAG